jgi:predicted DNA-binding protein (MmcQ/YjbR family)
MKLRKILMTTTLAAAFLATLATAAQSDKQPVTSNTGRFGDPSATAIKYQGYLYGVIKEKNPNELILTHTKFGIEHAFKLNKKTKYIQDGKASSFDKLKVGDRIFIDVDTDKKTGDLIAKKVVSGVDIPSIPSAP